jgi:sec-independent protein translocase protein TatB
MFGMGFMEIFLVLIIAIIVLGPEKLLSAVVKIVKFFKQFKSSIDDAKTTLDHELNISQMKQEANEFKSSVSKIKNMTHVEMEKIINTEVSETKNEVVKKRKKSKKEHSSLNKNKAV